MQRAVLDRRPVQSPPSQELLGQQLACSFRSSQRRPNPIMLLLPDDDDCIRRVRFAGVGRPKYPKRVRSEDRYEDHRYRDRIIRFHKRMLSVRWIRFYDASVGFFVATQGRIGIASFEGGARSVTQGTAASEPPIQQMAT